MALNVSGNFMIAQWILGKDCSVQEFADKIGKCPMDVVCVSFTKEVSSTDSMGHSHGVALAHWQPNDAVTGSW